MRASGHQPAARRADTSASKPSSRIKVTPRRAVTPLPEDSPFLKRAGKATTGLAVGAALVGGIVAAGTQPAAASVLDHAPTLHPGSRGTAVVRLQKELSAHGRNVAASGYFGSLTKRRVNHLKANHGWRTDGVAGRRVWSVLLHDGHRVTSPSLIRRVSSTSGSTSKALRALSYAKRHLGDSYRYGAAGPNAFDCSGLTLAAYRSVGIRLPHNTVAQYRAVRHVSRSNLRKGDLVFFYSGRSHVAIYAGDGRVIHAGRPGEPIRYIKMKYMPYNGAGRPA
jgi:peptidoglycan DL-endopeptidase CwlO